MAAVRADQPRGPFNGQSLEKGLLARIRGLVLPRNTVTSEMTGGCGLPGAGFSGGEKSKYGFLPAQSFICPGMPQKTHPQLTETPSIHPQILVRSQKRSEEGI